MQAKGHRDRSGHSREHKWFTERISDFTLRASPSFCTLLTSRALSLNKSNLQNVTAIIQGKQRARKKALGELLMGSALQEGRKLATSLARSSFQSIRRSWLHMLSGSRNLLCPCSDLFPMTEVTTTIILAKSRNFSGPQCTHLESGGIELDILYCP